MAGKAAGHGILLPVNPGIWCALGAFATWGLFPLYWRWLHGVPPLQLLGHRILWSCMLLWGLLLAGRRRGTPVFPLALSGKVLGVYSVAAVLIAINWLIYVWAVNAGHVIESSLGYFINPLVSVVLGVFILGERLRRLQWAAVMLAGLGVGYLVVAHGAVPWIALSLACSFGLYGLVKKIAPLGSLHGLTLETTLLALPALAELLLAESRGEGAFLHRDVRTDALLCGAGLVTTVPLLLFATAARRIPLSLLGVIQYVAPTLQFLLGRVVFEEPFTREQLAGYSLVWAALAVLGSEGLARRRQGSLAMKDGSVPKEA